jgi:hypothetical protein
MDLTKIISLLLVLQSLGCALPRRDAAQTTAEKDRARTIARAARAYRYL